jgi:4-alpha-glucanotransferase
MPPAPAKQKSPPALLSKPRSRASGILLHVTSLPSPFGIGDLGPAAHRWVDQLARARQRWWQVLPLNPPDDSNSPYSALSAFAGNPYLVSPEALVRDGFLRRADVPAEAFPAGRVAFGKVKPYKDALLAAAWERFKGGADAGGGRRAEFEQFREAHAGWLDDYALFVALRERQPGKHWTTWDAGLLRRSTGALRQARHELSDAVDRHAFAQFLFDGQLAALRAHAAERGVGLIGDLPIYVSGDSADVWSNPHLFQLDRDRRPKAVAGVPPDLFCDTGQRWGNPLFDWKALARDGYRWWVDRMRGCLRQADLVRIDHFRGLAGYWSIPASHPTAQHGKWVTGPGADLMNAMREGLGGLPVIAEDLGEITPDVYALRDAFGLPGMLILHFAFGGDDNAALPHNHPRTAVVYTGTHDNDTTVGWFKSLDSAGRKRVARYAPEAAADPAWGLLRLAWSSVADLAIAPLQDVLGLGNQARMNLPGVGTGNWGWRFAEKDLTGAMLDRLGGLTETYGRAAPRPAPSPANDGPPRARSARP